MKESDKMKVFFKTKKGSEHTFPSVTDLRLKIYEMFPNTPIINLGLIKIIELGYGELERCVINNVRVM